MTRHLVFVVVLAMGWCSRIQTPPYGGPNEEALVAATLAHDAAKVRELLAAGANPNKAITHADQSQSAWSLALERFTPTQDRQAQIDIVQAMLTSGADPDAAWGTNGGDVAQKLTSVGRRSFSLRFPLELAMYSGDPAIVGAILRAKPSAAGGGTALVMAIERRQNEVAHLLVEAGVDVNSTGGGATTPLLAAIEARDEAMMIYLEQHGAREKP